MIVPIALWILGIVVFGGIYYIFDPIIGQLFAASTAANTEILSFLKLGWRVLPLVYLIISTIVLYILAQKSSYQGGGY